MNQNTYIEYYENKCGSGLSDFGPIYYTPRIIQHGRGFGNFFASLFNYLKPLISSGLNAVKETAITTGVKALSEVGDRPLKEILIEHGAKAAKDLEQKYKRKFQNGKGIILSKKQTIKRNHKANLIHSTSLPQTKRIKKNSRKKKNKEKERVLDIFSSQD